MFGYVQDNYNIHDLVKVAPKSLTARDPVYKLYPFLLAACNPRKLKLNDLIDFEKEHIETIYILLREAPWVMDILMS